MVMGEENKQSGFCYFSIASFLLVQLILMLYRVQVGLKLV